MPVANYTECIWKIDLHNFFHFVKLRSDSHAQREIRDYADAMYELVKPNYPLCCEAFEDYIQDSRYKSVANLIISIFANFVLEYQKFFLCYQKNF